MFPITEIINPIQKSIVVIFARIADSCMLTSYIGWAMMRWHSRLCYRSPVFA